MTRDVSEEDIREKVHGKKIKLRLLKEMKN